jgi:hypothetical protein
MDENVYEHSTNVDCTNLIKQFHVFIDASHYVVGVILAQNLDNTIDHPI